MSQEINIPDHMETKRLGELGERVIDFIISLGADTVEGFIITATLTLSGATIHGMPLKKLISMLVVMARTTFPEDDVKELMDLLGIEE
jgi:hypothetical protein